MYSDSLSIERAQSTSNLQSGDFGVFEQDCGCYCKFCVLFADNRDARITSYGALVNWPLTNWKKATTKLSDHFGKAKYHAEAVELASNFTDTMSGHTQPMFQCGYHHHLWQARHSAARSP